MPIRPPQRPFRVEEIEVIQVPKVSSNSILEPIVQFRDREVIREVEKIVYQDDPKLLDQLNAVFRENGDLRQKLSKINSTAEPVYLERIVEVQVPGSDTKKDTVKLLVIGACAFILGIISCWQILK